MSVQTLRKKVVSKQKKSVGKKYTKFRPQIKSRHPSHSILRTDLKLLPFRSIVRLGSTTVMRDGFPRIECNSVQSVRNSANKLLMKECFMELDIKTAIWWTTTDGRNFNSNNMEESQVSVNTLEFPIVAKHIFGSRGTGNTLLKSKLELDSWLIGKTLNRYIFESFYSYSREYRLHVTKDGVIYTCRKMLKEDTPENDRWYRNDSNSVWILESNIMFDKPLNWDNIVNESIKALDAVGLDIGAVDVKVQSRTTKKGKIRENPEFIILEINSAPSFGELTSKVYLEEIPKILTKKYESIH